MDHGSIGAEGDAMMRFAEAVAQMRALFAELEEAEPLVDRSKGLAKKCGVYAFFEHGRAVYVGQTRNLQRRLKNHVTPSHNNAAFAFKQARQALGKERTRKKKRADLEKDPVFRAEFSRQIARVEAMQVRFIELSDPVLRYIFELYAAMAWKLSLDEFDTH
jgi:hypothetical protein